MKKIIKITLIISAILFIIALITTVFRLPFGIGITRCSEWPSIASLEGNKGCRCVGLEYQDYVSDNPNGSGYKACKGINFGQFNK